MTIWKKSNNQYTKTTKERTSREYTCGKGQPRRIGGIGLKKNLERCKCTLCKFECCGQICRGPLPVKACMADVDDDNDNDEEEWVQYM